MTKSLWCDSVALSSSVRFFFFFLVFVTYTSVYFHDSLGSLYMCVSVCLNTLAVKSPVDVWKLVPGHFHHLCL